MNNKKMMKCLVAALTVSVAACSKPDNANNAETSLKSLLASEWEHSLSVNPDYASYLGDKRFNQQWPDKSLASIAAQQEKNQAFLTQAKAIDKDALSADSKLNLDLFRWLKQIEVDAYPFKTYLMPINQMGGVQTQDDMANFIAFDKTQDYQDWLVRLQTLPALIDQEIALMREGIKQGVVPPKVLIQRVPDQIQKQLVSEPEQSLFYKRFEEFPDVIAEEDRQRLQQQAKAIIAESVVPAYKKLHSFIVEEYLPNCRDTHGVWDLPNGKAYYEYLVKEFTTTELSPEEIHQIGLKEVARNRQAMEEIIKEVGFEGDFQAFVKFLREDPQFYYETPEELYNAYLAISKKLDPEVTFLFGKLPRAPYGVKPIPDAIAPDTTTAYYYSPAADGSRPGYYYVNLHAPETRPKYEMEVLSVHEAVPGHHLQLALQQELGELPEFRRYNGFTVYIEGWGLYSERLGYEMGLYKDPYSRFGQLTYDMWRAVRLVVDTGMHYKGWTREEAIEYFKANAAKSEQDITNEIDRYLAWPGQALAYKIGQLKILELREKAEQQLGDDFDIRAFHDTVLGSGFVPLYVLEANVNQWLAQQAVAQ